MSKGIYHRLESIGPSILRRDIYRHAQENKIPLEFLTPLKGSELLKLEEAQLYDLPRSRKTNLRIEKGSPSKSRKAIQLVCNFTPYSDPEVGKIELTLCNIPNPYAIFQVAPLHSSGGWPKAQLLQTWRNTGKPSQKCRRTH